jgi:hypothetical protein
MSAPEADHQIGLQGLSIPDLSGVVPTSTEARAKRRIAALEEELQTMRQERGIKQRFDTYHFARSVLIANRFSKKDNLLYRSRQSDSSHGRPLH